MNRYLWLQVHPSSLAWISCRGGCCGAIRCDVLKPAPTCPKPSSSEVGPSAPSHRLSAPSGTTSPSVGGGGGAGRARAPLLWAGLGLRGAVLPEGPCPLYPPPPRGSQGVSGGGAAAPRG